MAEASEKSLNPITEEFEAGYMRHEGLFEHIMWGWSSNLKWTHYDFGNVKTHNSKHNVFSGNLKMNFDIASSPIPDIFTDSEGNQVAKEFDYIGISAIFIGDQSHGKLSNNMPSLTGLTPAEYETDDRNIVSGGDAQGSTNGYDYKWDPNPILSTPRILNTVDFGIQPQSTGSSLNPTTKTGAPIWDAKDTGKSMTDCEFTYNIGSISPLIYEYGSTLTYYYQKLCTKDELISIIPWSIQPRVKYDINERISETRSIGLHVINRYIQTEIHLVFNVWARFRIEVMENDEIGLQAPSEYYDDLAWQTTVDGFGGGHIYQEPIQFNLFGLGVWGLIMVILVVIVVVYIFIKVFPLILVYRAGRKKK